MTYNRDAAVAYAKKWALSRNPAFYDFSNVGGDCTNFASQCIYAGANVMNYTRDVGWYYRSATDRAAAWTGVEYMYRFLTKNSGRGPYATEMQLEYAQPGDIIQLSFDYTLFSHTIVVIETYPQILIAAHSEDSLYRPLDTYPYTRVRLLHIEGARE